MSKPAAEYAGIPLPEVEVFSNRLLCVDTTEKVLNALNDIENIRQINMTGESLPKKINSGANKGLDNNHSERKVIKVGGQDVEIRYLVGAFYIELAVENEEQLDSAVEKIKMAVEPHLTFGYSVNVGRYSKFRDSLTDYKE
ncbi:MAG: methyl-coenzyme M reductase operon protein D [Candidatus Methanogranum gryphiswaldense]|jgi:methyl-coenzyme M reductase subunit D|nr:MAG: methyl-coenzyme M reductase operon protein D [Candidatus Methanogranum sp. U3.2.1]